MTDQKLVAKASTSINAPVAEVWDALLNPKKIQPYMFGTHVASDWKKGSPIVWKGEWKEKKYEDKGVILQLEGERVLRYSHYSPLSGLPEKPENYHTVTIELAPKGTQTLVSLSQDNNPTDEAREHSEKNWEMMLAGLEARGKIERSKDQLIGRQDFTETERQPPSGADRQSRGYWRRCWQSRSALWSR